MVGRIYNNFEVEIIQFLVDPARELGLIVVYYQNIQFATVANPRKHVEEENDEDDDYENDGFDEDEDDDSVDEDNDQDGDQLESRKETVFRLLAGQRIRKVEVGDGKRRSVLLDSLRNLDVLFNKHVPIVYLRNCRSVKLQVLAGFIDSDGCYDPSRNCFRIAQSETVHRQLFWEIVWMAWSLVFVVQAYRSLREANQVSRRPGRDQAITTYPAEAQQFVPELAMEICWGSDQLRRPDGDHRVGNSSVSRSRARHKSFDAIGLLIVILVKLATCMTGRTC